MSPSSESFSPDTVASINKAYEDALDELGLQTTHADRRVRLGQILCDLARSGETDPVRLRESAVRAMKRFDWIRHQAHELWEAENRPHGRDQDHWVQAEREFESHKDEIE
jgi:hypothetical protein